MIEYMIEVAFVYDPNTTAVHQYNFPLNTNGKIDQSIKREILRMNLVVFGEDMLHSRGDRITAEGR